MAAKSAIGNNLSIYLDLLRLLAAVAVFCNHAHTHGLLLPETQSVLLTRGREAVCVFFVLSGFVISNVVHEKEGDWRNYTAARVARIMPVAFLAIAVTTLCDSVGSILNPAFYASLVGSLGDFYRPISVSSAVSFLTFTNQVWFRHDIFGTDQPYWSLGFEIPYYVVFGLVCFCSLRFRAVAVALWALCVGPKIILQLPVWLLGVLGQRLVARNLLKPGVVSACVYVFSIVALYEVMRHLGRHATKMYTWEGGRQELINALYFLLLGACVMLNIISAEGVLRRFSALLEFFAKPIRWLAGGSFTLYVIHLPLLVLATSFFSRWPAGSLIKGLATLAIFVLIYLIAAPVERHKKTYSRYFKKLFGAHPQPAKLQPAAS